MLAYENAEHAHSATETPLGTQRLLSINDVAAITGHCPVVASQIIDESKRGFTIHSRKFILESSFFSYLKELEASR